ncbi:acyl-CoA N-acyltransferase [Trichoderma sp. SZMC 28013]
MALPTLQTPRLNLRPLTEHNQDDIINLDSDPQVTKYVHSGRPLTRDEAIQDHQERLSASRQVPGLGYWAGYLDDIFIGWAALSPIQSNSGTFHAQKAELGYRISPHFWRRGYAKEMACELLRYGFEGLGLVEVVGQTMAVNEASRATMKACGMQHVRTLYVEFEDPIPGSEDGEVEYAITREEWLGLQLHPK